MRVSFGDRLWEAMRERGPLCVGIDPHPGLLEQWGLPLSAEGVRTFGLRVVEAVAGHTAAVKPQVAFFECFGSAGLAALENVITACREAGVLCIVDAKRGDIGSTMAGYARAFLTDGSPLAGDAVTLSPYLGVGALQPALDAAAASGRGVFVLALTSNPQGRSVQHARDEQGRSVAAGVVAELGTFNRECDRIHIGPAGVVVGATVGGAVRDLGVDLDVLDGIVLAPGFGAQGAGPAQVRDVFGGILDRVLISSSRAVLQAGPAARDLRKACHQSVGELTEFLRA